MKAVARGKSNGFDAIKVQDRHELLGLFQIDLNTQLSPQGHLVF